MPRGEKSGTPETLAKRKKTNQLLQARRAQRAAERVLKRWVPDQADQEACKAWLKVKGINLESTTLTPMQRMRWVRRAKKEMT